MKPGRYRGIPWDAMDVDSFTAEERVRIQAAWLSDRLAALVGSDQEPDVVDAEEAFENARVLVVVLAGLLDALDHDELDAAVSVLAELAATGQSGTASAGATIDGGPPGDVDRVAVEIPAGPLHVSPAAWRLACRRAILEALADNRHVEQEWDEDDDSEAQG